MRRCLTIYNKKCADNLIKFEVKVPTIFSNGWRRYQNHYDEWTCFGPGTSFGGKMVLGCTAAGFIIGGYISGKDSSKWSVAGDTMFGCAIGTFVGIVGGVFWPILPFIPVPYVMYKGVRVLVDRKRKEKGI